MVQPDTSGWTRVRVRLAGNASKPARRASSAKSKYYFTGMCASSTPKGVKGAWFALRPARIAPSSLCKPTCQVRKRRFDEKGRCTGDVPIWSADHSRGIAESSPRHAGPPVFHIITAVILIVLALVHTILNRRIIFNYFKGTKTCGKQDTASERGMNHISH